MAMQNAGEASGMVQPPYIPKKGRGRNTNQLEFMKNVVLATVWKHPNAWPFHAPVNTVRLGLSDYHTIIKTPMDLGTIQKRLQHHYYNDVAECIYDFTTIFVNCYVYNDMNDSIAKLAKDLEKWFLVKIKDMPKEEKEFYRKENSSNRDDDEQIPKDIMNNPKFKKKIQNTEKYTKKTMMILKRLNR